MENVQTFAQEFGALQFQCLDDTFLFAELNHDMLLATLFRKSCILHFTGTCEMREYFIQLPIGWHIDNDNCSPNLFDFSCIKINWQRRILGQSVLFQFGIESFNHLKILNANPQLDTSYGWWNEWMNYLIRMDAFNAIDHFARQTWIGCRQTGHGRPIICDFECLEFVGDDAARYRAHNQRPIDKHGVGQMLCHRHTTAFKEFHIANARNHRTSHVSHRRIQTNLIDFANATEQILHLILGRLRCYVCHLNHFGRHVWNKIDEFSHTLTHSLTLSFAIVSLEAANSLFRTFEICTRCDRMMSGTHQTIRHSVHARSIWFDSKFSMDFNCFNSSFFVGASNTFTIHANVRHFWNKKKKFQSALMNGIIWRPATLISRVARCRRWQQRQLRTIRLRQIRLANKLEFSMNERAIASGQTSYRLCKVIRRELSMDSIWPCRQTSNGTHANFSFCF